MFSIYEECTFLYQTAFAKYFSHHCIGILCTIKAKYTLKNNEGAIKNGKSIETDNIGYSRRRRKKRKMFWTPLCASKHK